MAVSGTHRGWLLKHNEGLLAAVYNGALPGTTALGANTALNGVLLGTPVAPALAVDSIVISNMVASGDFLLVLNRGGNSENYLHADGSAGSLSLYAPNGAITLTPTTDVVLANGTGLTVGHTSQETISTGDGSTDLIPEVQVMGSAQADSTLMLAQFSTTDAQAAMLAFVKSGNAAIGSHTVVANDEYVGRIVAFADDGADLETPVAEIRFVVDDSGGPGASAIGGSIEFYTTADGGSTLTLAATIDSARLVTVAGGLTLTTGNVTFVAASDIAMPAATAAALEISDGTTKFYAFDTRIAVAGVTTHALDIADYTIASGAANVETGLSLAAHTLNYTGTTQVTTQVDTVVIGARTIAGDTATLTVDEANTLLLIAPTEGTNVTLTAAAALRILDAAGTPTNQYGIYIEAQSGGTTQNYAIYSAGGRNELLNSFTGDGRVLKLSSTMTDGNNTDGYGVFEVDITAAGTVAGTVAASSTWLNFAAAAVPGSNLICAQNNGIWLASGITATNATMIIGMRMQYVPNDGADCSNLYCFDTNIYDNVLKAIFRVNALGDLGGSTGAQTGNDYKVPIFHDVTANQTWYVNVYHT